MDDQGIITKLPPFVGPLQELTPDEAEYATLRDLALMARHYCRETTQRIVADLMERTGMDLDLPPSREYGDDCYREADEVVRKWRSVALPVEEVKPTPPINAHGEWDHPVVPAFLVGVSVIVLALADSAGPGLVVRRVRCAAATTGLRRRQGAGSGRCCEALKQKAPRMEGLGWVVRGWGRWKK